jgi:hypothetical protein
VPIIWLLPPICSDCSSLLAAIVDSDVLLFPKIDQPPNENVIDFVQAIRLFIIVFVIPLRDILWACMSL